ncbi:MAG: hypothetical protein FJZ11_04845 [Candidatus Omnitrophica bacterium]|nr:hypothetical protein [Candidatus Omnitrophota bacterium]
MQYFLYFIVILWSAVGLGLMLLPTAMLKLYAAFGKIKNIKPLCILPLTFGVLFFLSMKNLVAETFGYAMGLIAIFKGLYLLVIKQEKIKEILDWWINAPVALLRIWGAFLLALALVLLSLIK